MSHAGKPESVGCSCSLLCFSSCNWTPCLSVGILQHLIRYYQNSSQEFPQFHLLFKNLILHFIIYQSVCYQLLMHQFLTQIKVLVSTIYLGQVTLLQTVDCVPLEGATSGNHSLLLYLPAGVQGLEILGRTLFPGTLLAESIVSGSIFCKSIVYIKPFEKHLIISSGQDGYSGENIYTGKKWVKRSIFLIWFVSYPLSINNVDQ